MDLRRSMTPGDFSVAWKARAEPAADTASAVIPQGK
jgi:hypothetical protein